LDPRFCLSSMWSSRLRGSVVNWYFVITIQLRGI
jgi:hypothetical protein